MERERVKEEVRALLGAGGSWVVLSGPMAVGKDTVAERLTLPGGAVRFGYGDLLREQGAPAWRLLEEYLATGRASETLRERVAAALGYPEEHAEEFITLALPALAEDPTLTLYSRTNVVRRLLQLMGSTWLPFPNFLPDQALRRSWQVLREGASPVLVGGRLLPDVEGPRSLGASIVRLTCSQETQLRRLKARDGLEATPALLETLRHPGETALASYETPFLFENDDDAPGALETLCERVNHALEEARRERVALGSPSL